VRGFQNNDYLNPYIYGISRWWSTTAYIFSGAKNYKHVHEIF